MDGTVAVQARQTLQETGWLLELASQNTPILGVVGWLPIASDHFSELLAVYRASPRLKGLRHVVQAEEPGFLDGEAFNRGIRALAGTGLVYDLLLYSPRLEEATRFVDRHPEQVFVLDHIAKPQIRSGVVEPWASDLRELARRPNVFCKASGMVTEADPAHWTATQLKPYFDVALESFGPSRLMIGTDWPVLTAGCDYGAWWRLVEEWIAPLALTEQAQILGQTAVRAYNLQPHPSADTTAHNERVL